VTESFHIPKTFAKPLIPFLNMLKPAVNKDSQEILNKDIRSTYYSWNVDIWTGLGRPRIGTACKGL